MKKTKRRINFYCVFPEEMSKNTREECMKMAEVCFAMEGITSVAICDDSSESEIDYFMKQKIAEGKTLSQACDVIIFMGEGNAPASSYQISNPDSFAQCVRYCKEQLLS